LDNESSLQIISFGEMIPRDDPLFPTMVIGSLPRPEWVVDLIDQRTCGRVSAAETNRVLDDAIPSVIRMQERAGLDYISDGEWRRENYARVFADKVGGFVREPVQRGRQTLSAVVVRELERRGPIVSDEAEFLRHHTDRKIIVALPTPSTIADLMWHPQRSASAYPTREAFARACVPILRDEISALVALGVDAVQLDEPLLHRLVKPGYYDLRGQLEATVDLSVETVNMVTQGFEEIFITVHLCHAHGIKEPETPVSSALMGRAVQEIHADRLAMEFNSHAAQELQALADFPTDKLLGLGVIHPSCTEVETPELVVERVQRALDFIDKERLVLNPDCGLSARSGADRAYTKLAAMCQGAELLRQMY